MAGPFVTPALVDTHADLPAAFPLNDVVIVADDDGAGTTALYRGTGSAWALATLKSGAIGGTNLSLTGTLTVGGTATFGGLIRGTLYGVGVVHVDASGFFGSGLIVAADIAAGAVTTTKIAGGINGQVLTTLGGGASWIAYAGDVTGSPGASTVVGLTGFAGDVAIHATSLVWDATVNTPSITQALRAASSGQTLTIRAQDAGLGVDFNGGSVIISSGAKAGVGHDGSITFETAGNAGFAISETLLTSFRPSLRFNWALATPSILQETVSGEGDGQTFSVQAQDAAGVDRNGGDLSLKGGAKTGSGLAGNVLFAPNGVTTAFVTPTQLGLIVPFVTFDETVGGPAISQAQASGNSHGQPMSIHAQDAGIAGVDKSGGTLSLISGAKSPGVGVDGPIVFAPGGVATAFVTTGTLSFAGNGLIDAAPGGSIAIGVNGLPVAQFDPDGAMRMPEIVTGISRPSTGMAFYCHGGSPTFFPSGGASVEVQWPCEVFGSAGASVGFLSVIVGGSPRFIQLFAP